MTAGQELDTMALMFGDFWDRIMREENLNEWTLSAVPRTSLNEALLALDEEEKKRMQECEPERHVESGGSGEVDAEDITDSDTSPLNESPSDGEKDESIILAEETNPDILQSAPIYSPPDLVPSYIPETQYSEKNLKRPLDEDDDDPSPAKFARHQPTSLEEDGEDDDAVWLD